MSVYICYFCNNKGKVAHILNFDQFINKIVLFYKPFLLLHKGASPSSYILDIYKFVLWYDNKHLILNVKKLSS